MALKGFLPSSPTCRSESLVREVLKRIAHGSHLSSPKKITGKCRKRDPSSLGSKCTSSVQSFLALPQVNILFTPLGASFYFSAECLGTAGGVDGRNSDNTRVGKLLVRSNAPERLTSLEVNPLFLLLP